MTEWQPIETCPEGVEVMTKIDDEQHGERNVTSLVMRTRIPGETRPMFWTPDGGMYVYYAPTHWMPLQSHAQADEAPADDREEDYRRGAAADFQSHVSFLRRAREWG